MIYRVYFYFVSKVDINYNDSDQIEFGARSDAEARFMANEQLITRNKSVGGEWKITKLVKLHFTNKQIEEVSELEIDF